jgi:hypothetical protein
MMVFIPLLVPYIYVGAYYCLMWGDYFSRWSLGIVGYICGVLSYTSPIIVYLWRLHKRMKRDKEKPDGWIRAAEKEAAKTKRI